MTELVAYQCENGIATLTLNNGKVNAFSPQLIDDFNAALDRAEQDKAIVIVTGQPGILSGGYDLGCTEWKESLCCPLTQEL